MHRDGSNGAFDSGLLDVGNAQQIYWERWGNPDGHLVVFLHGGPGSGCSTASLRFFDLHAHDVVLFDQRGCGRSAPLVRTVDDLRTNTTQHLIDDLERLRTHLAIERWTLLGGSWGTTLGLAYAQAHADRVRAAVFAGVTTTSRREVRWITHGMRRFFPTEYERFASWFDPDPHTVENLVDAYARLVFDEDVVVRERAAREWCSWEDTHVSLAPGYARNRHFDDPDFRLLFTRLVTHYWRHAGFVPDDALIRGAAGLSAIPAILLHGRFDISSPVETAWQLHRAWGGSELRIVENAGHGGGAMFAAIVEAIGRVSSMR